MISLSTASRHSSCFRCVLCYEDEIGLVVSGLSGSAACRGSGCTAEGSSSQTDQQLHESTGLHMHFTRYIHCHWSAFSFYILSFVSHLLELRSSLDVRNRSVRYIDFAEMKPFGPLHVEFVWLIVVAPSVD